MTTTKTLFMQSQTFFGSDSMIHSLFMRHLDRRRYEVFAACNPGMPGEPAESLKKLQAIPNLYVRPTYFGPTMHYAPRAVVMRRALSGSLPTLASLGALARFIRAQKIDIIHCTEKPRDAFYGFILSRLTSSRCIIHLHVKVEDWISPLVRWSMRYADGLIGVSDFVAESAIQMGYSADKVYTVVNGIDTSNWDPTTDGSSIRSEFGIAPHVPLLVIASRLTNWKGHTELLQALAKVKSQIANFKLLIVGEDDPRATAGGRIYSVELKALVQELGLNGYVVFTGFRKDIMQIMAAVDIYAMPSFEEPCAVAFIEALAMKKPVIAINSGGTPHLVEHGKSGLLSNYRDIDQMAQDIITLIKDPQLRTQMGNHGRKHVETYLTPQRMAQDLARVYETIMSKPQQKAVRPIFRSAS